MELKHQTRRIEQISNALHENVSVNTKKRLLEELRNIADQIENQLE